MLSVIAVVPAYNVEKFIEKCLTSVITQSCKVQKIFFIDDGSKDKTIKIVRDVQKKFSVPIKIIRRHHSGMRGKMINSILPQVDTEIIWIIEADAYYDKDYLKNSINHFKNEKVCGTIGRIHCWEVKTFLDRCRELELTPRYKKYKPFTAWIIRKKVLEEVGGFDERVWLFDDVIFGRVARQKNFEIIFEPKSVWYHNEKTSLAIITKQRYRWGYAYYFTLRYYRWIPAYIPLWTFVLISLGISIGTNFSSEFSSIGLIFFLAYTIFISRGTLKINKNPIYSISISLIKLYKQFITTLFFWYGLGLHALRKSIL